ncbi:O-antigen/teichoic acid export membrane protein [Nocardioides daedukensis]|uniref:O-antigen/teichoic acid export membrane protein n=1 Tax=Nocardioides daedukensis TaxID=634462 RepID=A0A7Y9S2I3_9ACTN|nr:O-antigen/teichoic acid export membrane protein [Nocardioides daedukensis]
MTYHVARNPERARDYVATSVRTMIVSGLLCLPLAFVFAKYLSDGRDARESAFQILALVLPVAFVAASFTFALQATRIDLWNWVRFSQPFVWFMVLVPLAYFGGVSLTHLMWIYLSSVVLQFGIALWFCKKTSLLRGRYEGKFLRPMLVYGLSHLASTLPAGLIRQLDVLFLAVFVSASQVGHYAVAVAYASLSFPLAAAVGSVLFPRQARLGSPNRTLRRSVFLVSLATMLCMVPMILVAPFLLPLVFGDDFSASVSILWFLFPSLLALSANQVCGDLLRGMGKPQSVAWATWISLVVLVVLLFFLVPSSGIRGAAISTSIAQVVACGTLMFLLFRKNSGVLEEGANL